MLVRLFAIWLLVVGSLWAYTTIDEEPPVYAPPTHSLPQNNETSIDRPADDVSNTPSQERLIYLTIEEIPKKIYVGEIFPVTIKIVSLRKHIPFIVDLEGGRNIEALDPKALVRPQAISHLTFYFKALGTTVELPAFVVRYEDSERGYRTESIRLSAIRLNPPAHFSGLLARNVKLENYQASAYEKDANILALQLSISYGNLEDFHLAGAIKQGIDSRMGDLNATTLLYYAVYPASRETVEFSYFNLTKNRYEKFQIPIIVKRTGVSTETDLDPQASEFTKFKIAATAVLIALWLVLWWRRGGWLYPLLIFAAGAYLVTYLIPLKTICLKQGATVYLLPTPQSTPFLRLPSKTDVKEMDDRDGYTKVQFSNNRIGWVKNEDLCAH